MRRHRWLWVSAVLSIMVVNCIVYLPVADIEFMGMDGLTLIETARIENWADVSRIFSEPMMNGSTFEGRFFRPVSVLTYSIDYFFWQLDLRGYLITNLLLHIGCALLVLLLTAHWFRDSFFTAWLSGLIFSLHPLAIENLIEPAGRQDILPTLLITAAVYSFSKAVERPAGVSLPPYVLSIFLFVAAFLSKEISLIVPPLILVNMLLTGVHTTRRDWWRRLRRSLLLILPFAVVGVCLLGWRQVVLGGVGGYSSGGESILARLQLTYRIVTQYFAYLFLPLEGLDRLIPRSPAPMEQVLALGLLALLLAMLFAGRHALHTTFVQPALTPAGRWLRRVLLGGVVLSTAGLLLLPTYTAVIDQLAVKSVLQHPDIMNDTAAELNTARLNHITSEIRRLILGTWGAGIVIGSVCLLLLHQPSRSRLREEQNRGVIGSLVTWILAPLGIYIATSLFAQRTFYVAIVPASLILARLIVERTAHVAAHDYIRHPLWRTILILFISSTAAMSLVTVTRSLSQVHINQQMTLNFWAALAAHIDELPQRGTLYIEALPYCGSRRLLTDYGIHSWIALFHPSHRSRIVVNSSKSEPDCPADVTFEVETVSAHETLIMVRTGHNVMRIPFN